MSSDTSSVNDVDAQPREYAVMTNAANNFLMKFIGNTSAGFSPTILLPWFSCPIISYSITSEGYKGISYRPVFEMKARHLKHLRNRYGIV